MEQLCKNCNTAFKGKFCNNCGQKYDVPRFSFKHILEEGLHAFTHADHSILSFAWQLLINPGKVAYEYIVERKRKKYFNPFTFFLLVTTFSLFLSSLILEKEETLYHSNNEYGHIFNVYGKVLTLAVIPLAAAFLYLLPFRKPKLFYSEYTVFSMMLISAYTVAGLFLDVVKYSSMTIFHSEAELSNNLVYAALSVVYLGYGDFVFHSRQGSGNYARSLVAGVAVLLVWASVNVFIIWAFFRNFQGIGTFDAWGIRISG